MAGQDAFALTTVIMVSEPGAILGKPYGIIMMTLPGVRPVQAVIQGLKTCPTGQKFDTKLPVKLVHLERSPDSLPGRELWQAKFIRTVQRSDLSPSVFGEAPPGEGANV